MTNNEMSDYEAERLIIDCPDIILEPVTGDVLKTMNGPGSIIQKAGGGFLLKFFCSNPIDIKSAFERINRTTLGKLIASSEYYRMSAIDLKGNTWTCDKLYPDFSSNLTTSKSIVTADLFEISSVDPYKKVKRNTLKLKFKGNFKIPVNKATHVMKQVAGITIEERTKINVCQFESHEIEIEITQEDEWMVVYADSEKYNFYEGLICRIIEALQLCMGRQLKWSERIIINTDNKQKVLRGIILNDDQGRTYKPVDYADSVNDAIHLMDCYLSKTIETKDTYVHPLFRPLFAVILASKSTTETEALTLVTSVESLVHTVVKNIPQDKETRKCIEVIKKHIDSSRLYPANFKKRINGLLGMMQSPSAVEKLNTLVKQGAIRSELIDIWKKLRPKVAHGNFSINDFQGFLDMVHSVHVLMHHLLFHSIGYSGQYIDYSAKGWPSLKYPKE